MVVKLSFLDASCCMLDVVNGGAACLCFSLFLTSVAVNGAPVTDFTFEDNLFTLPAGGATTLSVPAATFTQDETGAVTVNPGVLTVVLTGTV